MIHSPSFDQAAGEFASVIASNAFRKSVALLSFLRQCRGYVRACHGAFRLKPYALPRELIDYRENAKRPAVG
jgi:hypothetical protein